MIPGDLINLCLVCFLNNAKPVIHLIGTIHLSERNHFQTDNKLITLTRQNHALPQKESSSFMDTAHNEILRGVWLYMVSRKRRRKRPSTVPLHQNYGSSRVQRNLCLLFLIPQIYNTLNKMRSPDYPDRSKLLSWVRFCIIAETVARS